jgi:hypothetical protein
METETKVYAITKEHCLTMIHGVCDGCGGELEPIETVDNSDNPTFWAGCLKCSKYHWGTSKEVFQIAEIMVGKHHFIAYSHMDNPHHEEGTTEEQKANFIASQISGTCSIVIDVLRIQEQLKKQPSHDSNN